MKLGPFEVTTFYGQEVYPPESGWGANPIWTPYLTKVGIGRLHLHVFHRGDGDLDLHDHPWDFWTLPFVSYVEEVAVYPGVTDCCELCDADEDEGCRFCYLAGAPTEPRRELNVVRAWRLHKRQATYQHRVIAPFAGAKDGQLVMRKGPIVTLVWYGPKVREWGFLKFRDGRTCWQAWKDYLGGGKQTGCE